MSTKFPLKNKKRLWIHCASAGEYEQSIPLLTFLNQNLDIEICISFFSASGMEYYENLSEENYAFYLPFDSKKNAKRLINELQPDYILWVKYDFWKNILFEIFERKIPCDIIFADLRHIEQKNYLERNRLLNLLKKFSKIYSISSPINLPIQYQLIHDGKWMQSIANAQIDYKNDKIDSFTKGQKTILLGSAHLNDIKILSQYLKVQSSNEYHWIIVPHEIDEKTISEIKNLLPQAILYEFDIKNSNIIIINQIGVLKYLYRYAWIAWIGGGFDKSIHNAVEAIAYNIPIISGGQIDRINDAILLKNEKILQTFESVENLIEVLKNIEQLDRKSYQATIENLFKKNAVDNYSTIILKDIQSQLFI
ncbi:MAG: hypothetical protein M9958_11320 [Chitinophagales bacterium]|nr:hypothetical protein [Chitinophagales bacterium]